MSNRELKVRNQKEIQQKTNIKREMTDKKQNRVQLCLVKDAINQLQTNSKNGKDGIKKLVEELKEDVKKLKGVDFKDSVKKGVECGELIIDGADAKNAKTKRFAGKAIINDVDNNTLDKIDELGKKNEIANLSKRMGALVGQAQLYDIAEKLEILSIEIKEIHDFMINERESELEAAIEDIKNICLSSEMTDNELLRINGYIPLFGKHSKSFKKELDKQIGKGLYESDLKKVIDKLLEGVFWFAKNDSEAEKVESSIKKLTYSQKGYVYSSAFLILCYEILGEKQGEARRNEFDIESDGYYKRISQHVCYLINDEKTSVEESKDLKCIIENNKGHLSENIIADLEQMLPTKNSTNLYLKDYSFEDYCKLIEEL